MPVTIGNLRSTWANSSATYTGIGMNVSTSVYGSEHSLIRVWNNNAQRFRVTANGDLEIHGNITANGIISGVVGGSPAPFNQANLAFSQANQAFAAANSAGGGAVGAAFGQANLAYARANTGNSWIQYGTGAIVRTMQDRFRETVSVKDFGAVGDGVTDDRIAIQAAIDAVAANGPGGVIIPSGTYMVGASGNTSRGREYAITLKSDVSLIGAGSKHTKIKLINSANSDIFVSPNVATANIAIVGLTIDGNEPNQPASTTMGFGVWAHSINQFALHDVYVRHTASWGLRIQRCNYVTLDNILVHNTNKVSSDGVHFVDTSNVVGNNIDINTLGDDGFIIENIWSSIENYAISNLIVSCNVGRPILLLNDEAVSNSAHTIRNVSINNAVVAGGDSGAVVLAGSNYHNIHVQAEVANTRWALYLQPGSSTWTGGVMRNCSFNIDGRDITEDGIVMTENYGTITGNHLDARISNHGNNFVGANIYGNKWTGAVRVDSDPHGTKANSVYGVVLYGSNNALDISSSGSTYGVLLQGTAANNIINLGDLSDCPTPVYILGGAADNLFVGGRADGTVINNGGSSNRFIGLNGDIISGRSIIMGHTTPVSIGGLRQAMQIHGTLAANSAIGLARWADAASGPGFVLAKSRNATIGSHTIVQNNENIAYFNFYGSDGIEFLPAASIQARIGGTPGVGAMPGVLTFLTTSNSSSSLVERVRITEAGNVGIGTTTPTEKLHVVGNITATGSINASDVLVNGVALSGSEVAGPAAFGQANLAFSQANQAFAAANSAGGGAAQGNFKTNNVVRAASSNAAYTIDSFKVDPLKLVRIEVVPDPIDAAPEDDYGFTTTIQEFPNITE